VLAKMKTLALFKSLITQFKAFTIFEITINQMKKTDNDEVSFSLLIAKTAREKN
jgi:hypothetical protein